MVGKAHSKGCQRCRRHKKGCDGRRPRCGQCCRLDVACQYENRAFIFVNGSEKTVSSGLAQVSRLNARSPRGGYHNQGLVNSQDDGHSDCTGLMVLPTALAQTMLAVRLEESFWEAYLPHGASQIASEAGGSIMARKTLQSMAGPSTMAQLAIRATALASLGRLTGNRDYLNCAVESYVRSLRKVNQHLQRPSSCNEPAVLATTQFLALYELFRAGFREPVSSAAVDWQSHVRGTCRLMEIRGPAAFKTSLERNLVAEIRLSAAICGIVMKRPIGLDNPKWARSGCNTAHSDSALREDLIEIMSLIPELLSQQDQIHDRFAAGTDVAAEAYRLVMNESLRIAELLLAWEHAMLQLCITSINSAASLAPVVSGQSALSRYCRLLSYHQFDLITIFWFSCVMLFGRIAAFHQAVKVHITRSSIRVNEPAEWPALSALLDPAPYAASIAHNAARFYERGAGLWGAERAPICMAAGIHFCSAFGLQDSHEMRLLQFTLIGTQARDFSQGFLRSLASATAPNCPGLDAARAADREALSQAWFGLPQVPYTSRQTILDWHDAVDLPG